MVLKGLRVTRGRGEDAFVVEIGDLEIPRGSFTAILGGSGIGKTTLLTVLGLLRGPRDDPEFRIDCEEFSFHLPGPGPGASERIERVYERLSGGKAQREMSRRRRETLRRELIGFCLQGGELLPSLSLVDNCAAPAHLCRLARPLERAAGFLERLGMVDPSRGNHLGKLPGSLSGGQKQRGILARALAHDPALVILDEPTTGLDRGTAREAVALLQRQAREHGQTVLMVTHDQKLADEFADLVLEMDLTGPRRSGISARRRPAAAGRPSPPQGPPEVRGGFFAGRLLYYLRLGILDALGPVAARVGDALRARRPPWQRSPGWARQVRWSFPLSLLKNAVIVIAVGLLVILMRGMRSGLVQDLRDDLSKSPTAREVTVTPLLRTGALREESLARIQREHPEIEVIVPEMARLVASTKEAVTDDATIDLVATTPADPKLQVLDRAQDFGGLTDDAVVIYSALANRLRVKPGDRLPLWFVREGGAEGEEDIRGTTLAICNIVEGAHLDRAYVHIDFARQVQAFKAGRPVESREWPGLAKDVPPRYSGFLVFAKEAVGAPVEKDLSAIGLEAIPLDAGDERRTLFDLLAPLPEGGDHVYLVRPQVTEAVNPMPLGADLARLPQILTRVQGILFPWNEPLEVDVEGVGTARLVGITGWERWLKPRLLRPEPLSQRGWQARPLAAGVGTELTLVRVPGAAGLVELLVDRVPPARGSPAAAPAVLFVPADFLARLRLCVLGEAVPDSDRRVFLAASEEVKYFSARIFVKDIDHVVGLHDAMEGSGYLVESSHDRVREIQGYSSVLAHLTEIVSILAALTALLTVGVVFHEIAESKKRMIGTLRIMGLSRFGALTLLVVRGVIVAGLSSGLVVALGHLAASALNGVRPGLCLLTGADFASVAAGIAVVCVVGTWWPAHRVSRVDPVVALQQAEEK